MTPIVESTDADRPAADVYAYVTDPARFNEWQQGVVSGRMERDDESRPHRCITVRKVGFTTRTATAELVRDDPPRAWGVRGIDGPVRAWVDVTVEPITDASSRVTVSVEFDGHGIGKLLVPMLILSQARREMPANMSTLKSRIESMP